VRRLIINADDFGLTPGINRAIAQLYDAGALTSATLMANGAAFDDALSIALQRPGLAIGCHITLVDAAPLSPPTSVPSLLCSDAIHFRRSFIHFMRDLYSGRINMTEVALEATAQIQKLRRSGINITHIDTHKHTHISPRVATCLLTVAEHFRIPAIRSPFEDAWSRKLSVPPLIRYIEVSLLHALKKNFRHQPQIMNASIHTTDGTIGITTTGRLNAAALQKMFHTMPSGTWELVCHPGYNDADLDQIHTRLRASREIEYHALLKEIPQLIKNHSNLELINYGKIIHGATL